jgi:hypothetical protein
MGRAHAVRHEKRVCERVRIAGTRRGTDFVHNELRVALGIKTASRYELFVSDLPERESEDRFAASGVHGRTYSFLKNLPSRPGCCFWLCMRIS